MVRHSRVRITPHFFADEFAQPSRHALPHIPYPAQWFETRLRPLCDMLETLRLILDEVPIRIISGYRSKEYNRKIRGAKKSQHVLGLACDIVVPGRDAPYVHDIALYAHRSGQIQLGGLGRYSNFTHLDIRPGRLRRWSGK